MYRRHGNKLAAAFLACDLVVTGVTWLVAYAVRFGLLPSPEGIPDLDHVVAAIPAVLLLAALAYHVMGLYEVHRLKQLPREFGQLCKAGGLLFVMIIVVTFYRRDLYESRLALGFFLVFNVAALTLARRLIWRAIRVLRRKGLNYGRALVVGTGRTGRLAAKTIRNNDWTGLELVGFVDRKDRPTLDGVPYLGPLDRLTDLIAEHEVDHVFVALPLSRYAELPTVYGRLSETFCEVQLVPDLPDATAVLPTLTEIDNVGFLDLRRNPQRGWLRHLKRTGDVLGAVAALILLAPLMLLIAAAIKLTSRGPVFYRQTRTSLGGRSFEMLKFRSMVEDAETRTGPVWTRRGDDRRTPLGRFLRRWSLDELPQFFNILAGDMSLVGPRPERTVFVERFRKQLPGYCQRLQVKAGLTGWAQVQGWRGNTSVRRRLQCDLYYIANWSLLLDLKILLMTPFWGMRGGNAY